MPETPQYTVEYRNAKHPRLEYKTGTLRIILPKNGWTPQQVLEKYGQWIKRKQATINAAVEQINGTALVKNRTDKEPRSIVQRYAEAAQSDLHTKINKIYYRKMTTKWASHSKNNNLTVKYAPQIFTRRPDQLYNLPRNRPRHRKKTAKNSGKS
ncbi:MAG: hypothetical protein QW674_01370 [Candidatus Bathyarchaeia archaeon]